MSASDTNIGKLLKLLEKQRLVKSFANYENSAGRGADGLPLQKRQTMKRMYWYIDYHDFVLVIKYRLAVMRSQIEASMVKDDTAKCDYKCPQCAKEFDALQVPMLIQNIAMQAVDMEGDFIIACDVCGGLLEPKMNAKEQSEADRKMETFNNALAPIRKTLQQVERIEFEKFEPINWLLNHVPETIIVERNAKGHRVYLPSEARKEKAAPELTPEEKQARIAAEQARKAEIEANKQILPTWAVQSTVTGQQTELGVKHDKLRQTVADREARLARGQQDTKVDTSDADLDKHYAELLAAESEAAAAAAVSATSGGEPSGQEAHDTVPASSTLVRSEADVDSEYGVKTKEFAPSSAPSPAAAAVAAGDQDEEEEMEEMEAVETPAARADNVEALKNTVVKVGEQDMRFGDVTDEDQERMSSDEYLNYYRIAEELAQMEDPAGGAI